MSSVAIWRDKPGALLGTYAKTGSRTPLAQDDAQLEKTGAVPVSAEELTALVMGGDPFPSVYVSLETAENVLGWQADTE